MSHTIKAFVTDDLPRGSPPIIFGGQNRELNRALGIFVPEFPPLDPASNFTRFTPPSATDTPETLFAPKIPKDATVPAPRLTRISNAREFLIYVDGSCSNNGTEDASAGCAFVFRPETSISTIPAHTSAGNATDFMKLYTRGHCKFRLESCGPNGEIAEQTSNRAELRATIAVLQFRYWTGEGFQRLVIATDSSYTVGGCTEWVKKWQRNGWNTAAGKPVKNRDLWEEIIKEVNRWSEKGMQVQFWLIPRSSNALADSLAKEAAKLPSQDEWTVPTGVMC